MVNLPDAQRDRNASGHGGRPQSRDRFATPSAVFAYCDPMTTGLVDLRPSLRTLATAFLLSLTQMNLSEAPRVVLARLVRRLARGTSHAGCVNPTIHREYDSIAVAHGRRV